MSWARAVENLLSFILVGFALAGSPGPNTLSLAATGAAFGARRSLAFMAGLTLGMIGVMAIVAGGLVTAIMALPGVTPILLTIAVVYFGYLAFRIATAPPLSEATEHYGNPSFVVGVLQSFINPKAYAAMAALFSGFVLVQDRMDYDVASKMIVSITIIVVVNIIWLFAGAALTRLFKNRRTNRAVNVSFACVLIASMAFALLV